MIFPLGYFVPGVENSPLLQGWTLYIQWMQLSKMKRGEKKKIKVLVTFVCENQKEVSWSAGDIGGSVFWERLFLGSPSLETGFERGMEDGSMEGNGSQYALCISAQLRTKPRGRLFKRVRDLDEDLSFCLPGTLPLSSSNAPSPLVTSSSHTVVIY